MKFSWLILVVGCCGCVFMPSASTIKSKSKTALYTQVDLEEMIRRNIAKTHDEKSIEGIYTVSCVITKKGKTLLSPTTDKLRTILRKDNYARVAIVKDWPGSDSEYIEISLTQKGAARQPIVAELTGLSEGGGFIYKHFEPKGKTMSFTFLYDQAKPDILEGVYTLNENGSEIVYKLTYVKVYPKANNLQASD